MKLISQRVRKYGENHGPFFGAQVEENKVFEGLEEFLFVACLTGLVLAIQLFTGSLWWGWAPETPITNQDFYHRPSSFGTFLETLFCRSLKMGSSLGGFA